METAIEAVLVAGLGAVVAQNGVCVTTTSTSTTIWPSTSTTSTLIP
jgi:riboflavin synthase alpha subunit